MSKERVREFMATLNRERGVTVLLTTHDLTDIERCRRVMVIDRGSMVHDGSLNALRERFGTGRTRLPAKLVGSSIRRGDGDDT